jgi:hypothetical protein
MFDFDLSMLVPVAVIGVVWIWYRAKRAASEY